jgi:DNA-binding transcriptional ArsR family regulator
LNEVGTKMRSMSDAMIVSDPKAAQALSRPMSQRVLMALIERERSLTEISVATGASMSLCHHHVGRLVELKLVEIAHVERRAGAPIKRYRPVAPSFFVPAELLDRLPGDTLTTDLRAALERSRAGALAGVLYTKDGASPRARLVLDQATTPWLELWLELRLSDADARALIKDLKALLDAYAKKPGDGKAYIVHGAVAGRSTLLQVDR